MNRNFLILAAALFATPALAVDPTGVKPCDDLLTKYESCSSQLPPDKAHKAQIEMLQGAMSIRAAAEDPKLRAELESYCRERFEQMKRESLIKECMAK